MMGGKTEFIAVIKKGSGYLVKRLYIQYKYILFLLEQNQSCPWLPSLILLDEKLAVQNTIGCKML